MWCYFCLLSFASWKLANYWVALNEEGLQVVNELSPAALEWKCIGTRSDEHIIPKCKEDCDDRLCSYSERTAVSRVVCNPTPRAATKIQMLAITGVWARKECHYGIKDEKTHSWSRGHGLGINSGSVSRAFVRSLLVSLDRAAPFLSWCNGELLSASNWQSSKEKVI